MTRREQASVSMTVGAITVVATAAEEWGSTGLGLSCGLIALVLSAWAIHDEDRRRA